MFETRCVFSCNVVSLITAVLSLHYNLIRCEGGENENATSASFVSFIHLTASLFEKNDRKLCPKKIHPRPGSNPRPTDIF